MALKKQLVKEQTMIKDKYLVTLPRKPSAADVLKDFAQTLKPPEAGTDYFDEVMEGVLLYFDKALGTMLLYRFERVQFTDINKKHPDTPMSQIYGPEHLLRLFVKLPILLAEAEAEEKAQTIVRTKMEALLEYMNDNKKELFLTEYEPATPQYRRMAE